MNGSRTWSCRVLLLISLAAGLPAQTEPEPLRDPYRPEFDVEILRAPGPDIADPTPIPPFSEGPSGLVATPSDPGATAGVAGSTEESVPEGEAFEEPAEFVDGDRFVLEAWWDGELRIVATGRARLPDGTIVDLRILSSGRPLGIAGRVEVNEGRFEWRIELPGRLRLDRYRVEATFRRSRQVDPEALRALAGGDTPDRLVARAWIGSDEPVDLLEARIDWQARIEPLLTALAAIAGRLEELGRPGDDAFRIGDRFDQRRWMEGIVATRGELDAVRRAVVAERALWVVVPDRKILGLIDETAVRSMDVSWLLALQVLAAEGAGDGTGGPMPDGWPGVAETDTLDDAWLGARSLLGAAWRRLGITGRSDLERGLVRWVQFVAAGAIEGLERLHRKDADEEDPASELWRERSNEWTRRLRLREQWLRGVVATLRRVGPLERDRLLEQAREVFAVLQVLEQATTRRYLASQSLPIPAGLAGAPSPEEVRREVDRALRPLREGPGGG